MRQLPNEQQLFSSKDGSTWIPHLDGNPRGDIGDWLHQNLTWDEMCTVKRQSVDLNEYKETKKDQIRASCRGEITNLFVSDALGSNHNYDCREEDQANIVTRAKASEIDSLPKKVWAHDGTEFSRTDHTTAQLQQLVVDMESHIETCQAKLEGLINQVNACTTCDQVDAVKW
ncbi:tail fiber protein [Vibrio phage 11895-B1]|uniref:tail fiber protein n=1 Tax=Vibrio phage 11895-B1 TaxID=754075 RepID=UPI0002C044B8|nr:tail fiber protein [Vibrio phage 11895-B1]AGH32159.1 hypothetical protein VPHG_00092 [Vibrio phage 11895-B1]